MKMVLLAPFLFFERKSIVKKYTIFAFAAFISGCSIAPINDVPPPDASGHEEMGGMAGMTHEHHGMHDMKHGQHGQKATHHSHSDPFGGPYKSGGADCGGTILCPASSPHGGYDITFDEWNLMVHGGMHVTYTVQPGPRGESAFAVPNHLMVMADRNFGGGTVRFGLGMSFDALTEPRTGKPQLLQTGEMRDGRENVDVQHPHPLITNLSASYTHPLSVNGSNVADWFCTAALVGDVSGAPMEYHRASAKHFGDVSLFHHGTTDKHITSSVLSCGIDYQKFRVAVSGFHGREPGSNPYALYLGAPDSFAVNFQYLPSKNWALSLYYAHITNAERAEPGDIDRFTAAVMYTLPLEGDDWWATTAIFTHDEKSHGSANMFVLDSTRKYGKNYFYGRLEGGEKDSLGDMNTFGRPGLHTEGENEIEGSESEHARHFLIGAGTIGYARTLWEKKPLEIGVGADITGYVIPGELQEVYGSFPFTVNTYFFMHF